jgi:hypothetical protein
MRATELGTDRTQQVSSPEDNIWDAAWCGNNAFAAVASPEPGEGYTAKLSVTDIADSGALGESREICQPRVSLAGRPHPRQRMAHRLSLALRLDITVERI